MPDEMKFRFTREELVLDTDEKRMVMTAVLATEGVKDDGLSLDMAGWRIPTGDASIPLLWAHGYDIRGRFPLGNVSALRVEDVETPAGKVRGLVGEKRYYSPGEAVAHLQSDLVTMPAVVFDMRRQGYFRAVSVGFHPRVVEEVAGAVPAFIAREWDLHELSDCPVGLDPFALDKISRAAKFTEAQRDWLVGHECQHCGSCRGDDSQEARKSGSGVGWDTIGLALKSVTLGRSNG